MAEYSIRAVKTMQPEGPYLLAGYSAGGLIALEMAQRLRSGGDDAALLVLLDAYPGRQYRPLRCHAEILLRQSVKALWALTKYSPARLIPEVGRRIRSLCGYLAASGVSVLHVPPLIPEGVSEASRRVHVATFNAGERYRPRPYPARVDFIQPLQFPNLEPRSVRRAWGRLLPHLRLRRVPGDHMGMVEANAAATAARISECIGETDVLRPNRQPPVAGSCNPLGAFAPAPQFLQRG
jgi:thioesterase domain-containing protein